MSRFGSLTALFYRGPSLLDGSPIVGLLSGVEGESNNQKTGPMIQAYVLRSDKGPMEAVRDGSDAAICGDCQLRGDGAYGRKCYVTPFLGPLQVYKRFIAGSFVEPGWSELQALVEGRGLRLCAYGDPAAVPFEVWRMLLATAGTWTAYTHAWRTADPRLKTIAMASVDNAREFYDAGLRGWRTFRVRRHDEPLITGAEFVCPASDEAKFRTTCERCRLCRGQASQARSVAIFPHGKPSALMAYGIKPVTIFGRRPRAAEARV